MSQPVKKALIVDDEESMRYVLSSQLSKLGYECVTVSSGRDALDKAACQDFDLMMLDVKMPGMSGLEVLGKFRTDHPETCVVVLSALVDAVIAVEAIKRGADDYLTKPYHSIDLSKRLQRAHERRELTLQSEREHWPSNEAVRERDTIREITKDLVAQQMAVYERLSSRPGR
ncbi:MAG: response regulator [Chloroflexota bacterium]